MVVRPAIAVGCPQPLSAGSGYRMSRWARLGMTLTVAAALVVVAITLIARSGPDRTNFVTVEPGDTLWSVALRVAPDRDPRAVVEDVIAINRLSDNTIHVGEVLRVPAG
jgi:LysM repeat protein